MSFGKVHRINTYYMGNSSTLEALNFLYDASSHLLILLVELPVRLHSIEYTNSKIRIVSTLLNMSL